MEVLPLKNKPEIPSRSIHGYMIRVYCCEEHTLKYMLQNQKAEERKVKKTISMSSH